MSTRTVSARIDSKQHEKIVEICNLKGITINQFIINLIESSDMDREALNKWLANLDSKQL